MTGAGLHQDKANLRAAGSPYRAILVFVFTFPVLFFLMAGRLDWPVGWLFVGLLLVYWLGVYAVGVRRDRALFVERDTALTQADVPAAEKWTQAAILLVRIGMVGLSVVDAARFGWSDVPLAAQLVGWGLLVAAGVLVAWALLSNAFASSVVRIQQDRGQTVVTAGPYRLVRHPMYAGLLCFALGTPPALGSWWGLVLSAVLGLVVVVRTAREDHILHAELPGYAEYAQRVRYRLLPGVW